MHHDIAKGCYEIRQGKVAGVKACRALCPGQDPEGKPLGI